MCLWSCASCRTQNTSALQPITGEVTLCDTLTILYCTFMYHTYPETSNTVMYQNKILITKKFIRSEMSERFQTFNHIQSALTPVHFTKWVVDVTSCISRQSQEPAGEGAPAKDTSNRRVRPLYDIPYMFEAREFLRKKLIGKKVCLHK